MGTIYKLIIEDDEGKTTVYPLSQGEISIGRKEGNTIRLMERNVSRRHARLLRSNGAVYVEDLDSYNGIRINGERINGRYEVKEGDLVEIGDYHLALQAAEVEDEPPPPQPSKSDADAKDQWPLAGTVPDFRLPEEILAGVRAMQQGPQKGAAPRDTLVDQPAPYVAPTPAVQPASAKPAQGGFASGLLGDLVPPGAQALPSRPDETPRQLPPFPGPGASGPSMLARGPGADGDTRPPALKPAAQPARKDESLIATTPINVGPSRVAAVPRIVCVSTNYAGKEFALTRPELIIGRVEDNDIVIEHRSVSRNHAKIVFDGRAHKIIDLQSANGILVNGEEYAMTDLRKGDLIELGHVRFRFVPAGEAFVPTEDEIREMKEAGVQLPAGAPEPALMARTVESSPPPAAQMQASLHAPSTPPAKSAGLSAPSRPHDAPDVPHFDPSTAATVTDTPLSALSIGQMLTPQIEPSQPERSATPARKPAADAAHDRAPDKDRGRSDTAQPRSHDQRATEVNVAARANGAMSSPSPRAPTDVTAVPRASIVDTEERLAAPKSKTGLVVGLVAGIVILVGAAVFLLSSSGPDGAADRELAEQFKAGNFKGVLEHCQKNQGNYRDAQGALKLCVDAAAQLATQPKTEAKPEPKNEPEALPSGDAPKPETGAAAAKAEPTEAEIRAAEAVPEPPPGDADEPAPTEDAKTKAAAAATQKKAATKTNDRGAKAPDKIAKAKDLHDRAWRQWTNGDASKAIELLGQCITVANLPKCHRTLGSVYAQIGDTQKALEHYRRYLALDPTAPDVNRVKDIIREAEAQQ